MAGLDFDVGGLAFSATEGLVNHNFSIWQAESFAFCAAGEKNCAHGSGEAETNRGNVRFDVLHCVVNREAGCDMATWTLDVHCNVFFVVFVFEEKELGNDDVCNMSVNACAEENDTIL